jgi:hypothetical protein
MTWNIHASPTLQGTVLSGTHSRGSESYKKGGRIILYEQDDGGKK